jgi:hypothetical protein
MTTVQQWQRMCAGRLMRPWPFHLCRQRTRALSSVAWMDGKHARVGNGGEDSFMPAVAQAGGEPHGARAQCDALAWTCAQQIVDCDAWVGGHFGCLTRALAGFGSLDYTGGQSMLSAECAAC